MSELTEFITIYKRKDCVLPNQTKSQSGGGGWVEHPTPHQGFAIDSALNGDSIFLECSQLYYSRKLYNSLCVNSKYWTCSALEEKERKMSR